MPFIENVDFDKLMDAVLQDVGKALEGWLAGHVLEEIALMNRLIEQLSRRRRGCDIGLSSPMNVRCEVSPLHRKGKKQIDRYGSDFAVTVYGNNEFVKTCFIQLKKSKDLVMDLEVEQLSEAIAEENIRGRSFVLAVDQSRYAFRMHATYDLYLLCKGSQEHKRFRSTDWDNLTIWMWKWLSCDIGKPSDPRNPDSVENLLKSFVAREEPRTLWGRNQQEYEELPSDFLPARVWLQVFIEPKDGQ